jgi:hypothetical protein
VAERVWWCFGTQRGGEGERRGEGECRGEDGSDEVETVPTRTRVSNASITRLTPFVAS